VAELLEIPHLGALAFGAVDFVAICGGRASSGAEKLFGADWVEEETVKILIIEDDQSIAEMYRLRLAADGFDVVIGQDGETGLQLAATAPDFIYLDIRLPGIDGFEVLGRLRAEAATAAIPVIILSNYGDPALRDRGLSLGAVDFATKADMTPGQLSAMVKRLVGGPPEPAA
jgi:DNA-binding response OmpR family regulator